jgi:small subunit ribosomal protein S17
MADEPEETTAEVTADASPEAPAGSVAAETTTAPAAEVTTPTTTTTTPEPAPVAEPAEAAAEGAAAEAAAAAPAAASASPAPAPTPTPAKAAPVVEEDAGRPNRRKVREGVVVSDAMQATVVVAVVERVRHPRYGKTVQRTKKLYVHDAEDSAKVGDRVRVQETRPLSKLKRWRLTEVLERAR